MPLTSPITCDVGAWTLGWVHGAPVYSSRERLLHACLEAAPADGLMCEFGVYRGDSIRYIAACLPHRTIYGFDSFEGLPGQPPELTRLGWGKGDFWVAGLPQVPP